MQKPDDRIENCCNLKQEPLMYGKVAIFSKFNSGVGDQNANHRGNQSYCPLHDGPGCSTHCYRYCQPVCPCGYY